MILAKKIRVYRCKSLVECDFFTIFARPIHRRYSSKNDGRSKLEAGSLTQAYIHPPIFSKSAMRIEDEIRQKRFKSEYQKAHINILFTAAWLQQQTVQLLKPLGISGPQFNILRILRGMHPEPASIKLLTERMIDKMSNASRLVDKLEAKGLVQRTESGADRRRVDVFITAKGLDILEIASTAVEGRLHKDMAVLSEDEAALLNVLLDKMRG